MTINFHGIERTITNESTTSRGTRCFYLAGPKVNYYVTETYPKQFLVLNSRFKPIGHLVEKDNGEIVEATYTSARYLDHA